MLKHLYLIFLSTFLLGFVAGALTLLFTSTGKEGDGALTQTPQGLIIAVYTYGGCERLGCPSYRIGSDNAYIYLPQGSTRADTKYTGTLTTTQKNTITGLVAHTDFARVQNTHFNGVCPITHDGIAYKYVIENNGVRYAFDSCKEATAGVSLFDALVEYFNTFNTTNNAQ